MPPMRRSATRAGSAVVIHSRAYAESEGPTMRSLRIRSQTHSRAAAIGERLGEELLGVEHLDAALAHRLGEDVVFLLGPTHPDDVVEEQFVDVRRCQPGVLQTRSMDHDLAQPADLGMDSKCHLCLLSVSRRFCVDQG